MHSPSYDAAEDASGRMRYTWIEDEDLYRTRLDEYLGKLRANGDTDAAVAAQREAFNYQRTELRPGFCSKQWSEPGDMKPDNFPCHTLLRDEWDKSVNSDKLRMRAENFVLKAFELLPPTVPRSRRSCTY